MFSGGLAKKQRQSRIRWAIYVSSVALVAGLALIADWPNLQKTLANPDVAAGLFPDIILLAARNTLIFTAVGFAGGFVIAMTMALMRISKIRAFRIVSTVYIEVLRGLPLLLTIILIGLGLPIGIAGFRQMPIFWRGVIALALVTGAYMAETIRAGIESVPPGQNEAGRSLGLSKSQTMRWIVLPQALRTIIPPLTNEFVILIKDTSLISVLGVTASTKELTRFAREEVISNANATPLIVAGLVYLALTIPLTQVARRLETKQGRV
ncbi:MAG TPA: amino acid ABC transporter permease [Acidimicrobiia bacterium]|nr:amino acid ABC transporter permease [Acidimicrobiia bacterium]